MRHRQTRDRTHTLSSPPREPRAARGSRRTGAGRGRGRRSLALLAALLWVMPAAAETALLSSILAAAPPGVANGHAFAHLAQLDPAVIYQGGALILEDTCIQGAGATLDLGHDCIVVAAGASPTRLDIDHCFITGGAEPAQASFGGGLEYGPGTQGWIVNNTFYDNDPCGAYLDELYTQEDGVKVTNNIFYGNSPYGLIVNEEQPPELLHVRHNNSYLHGGADYAEHCSCPTAPPQQIAPESLHLTNMALPPGFVQAPDPPKIPGDFHLLEGSPMIGAGEDGEDLGAYPYGDPPAVQPLSWGALKVRFRP